MGQILKNHQVIITGGTGNLGSAIILEFIRQGATVVTNFREEEKYRNLFQAVGNSDRFSGYRADLTVEDQVKAFFRNFTSRYKRLDIFLHITGGFWMGGEIGETPYDKWRLMQEMNLNSTFLCTREAFRLMKAQCSGKIFTISAKAAEDLPANIGAYAVSKSGVLALTRVLADEGKAYNIQVNSLLPSLIDTPENRRAMPAADYSQWVKPKDIARLLIHLSQPDAHILSGTPLKIYGKL